MARKRERGDDLVPLTGAAVEALRISKGLHR
jgi:hypothetical protein